MSDWVECDDVEERDLPRHAVDGRTGDRIAFLERGLLVVRGGRGTFARWEDILGVTSYEGAAYVLVPRKPPRSPWIVIASELLGADRDVQAFIQRLRERGAEGGYRSAVRTRRQNLSREALLTAMRDRRPVPGALEVPSTIILGREYPGLGGKQFVVFATSAFGGYAASVAAGVVAGLYQVPALGTLAAYPLIFGSLVLGGLLARRLGQKWRATTDATLPRQRVLVLAPDGCVVGFRTGVDALAWHQVGRFATEANAATRAETLVVYDTRGRRLGDIDAGWLAAPIGLVVQVADAYREAASSD